MERTFEIPIPAGSAREQWNQFAPSHEAEARFEPLSENRTRITLFMNQAQKDEMERVIEDFKNSLVTESVRAGNPGARGVEPGAAGGTLGQGSTGGTPGRGGGKAGSTPGGTPR